MEQNEEPIYLGQFCFTIPYLFYLQRKFIITAEVLF